MRLFALLLALGSAGCAGPSLFDFGPQLTISESELHRLGPCPTPEEVVALSDQYLEEIMIDPTAFLVRKHTEPSPAYAQAPILMDSEFIAEGWLWFAEVNGKNKFGGYVGWQTYTFMRASDGSGMAYDLDSDHARLLHLYAIEPEESESAVE